jgi:hypothetical protein
MHFTDVEPTQSVRAQEFTPREEKATKHQQQGEAGIAVEKATKNLCFRPPFSIAISLGTMRMSFSTFQQPTRHTLRSVYRVPELLPGQSPL